MVIKMNISDLKLMITIVFNLISMSLVAIIVMGMTGFILYSIVTDSYVRIVPGGFIAVFTLLFLLDRGIRLWLEKL